MEQINWLDWEPRHFESARTKKKPILLSISATWCHWCHRLDHDTLEKKTVAEFVNSHFVPIRVDTDKRPDINARYNAGGWPTIAILDTEGLPIQAGLYFPEHQFLQWLEQGLTAFCELKTKSPLAQSLQQRLDNPTDFSAIRLEKDELTEMEVQSIQTLKTFFDPQHFGFGNSQKFPHADALSFLAFKLRENANPDLEHILFSTLDALATRGLWDRQEKGFFRYCTTREWTIPHYEKMLEDNAALAKIFLDAFLISGREKYKTVALEIFEYLETHLLDSKTNCFFGSQDADEEYYQLPLDARKKRMPPSVDPTVFTDWNCMLAVAYLRAFAATREKKFFQKAMNIFNALQKETAFPNGKILHHLEKKSDTVFFKDCIWFAKAAIDLYQTTFAPEFLQAAEKTINFCLQTLWDEKNKGFWDAVPSKDASGLLAQPVKNVRENMLMVECLQKLAFWKNPAFLPFAGQTFKAFLGEFEHLGLFGTTIGLSAVLLRDGLNETKLVAKTDEKAKAWQFAFLKKYFEKSVMEFVTADSEQGIELAGKKPKQLPAAFICKKGACFAPVFDLDAFEKAI